MVRLRLLLVVMFALAMVGCLPVDQGLPENTISFTLDGVDCAWSASTGPATHAWGRGIVSGGPPPVEYAIRASASEADAEAGVNTIYIWIYLELDGFWYINAYLFDADGLQSPYYLGAADGTLLADLVENLDAVGEQMQGAFLVSGPFFNGALHTLENIVFSVERLPDYSPPS
jgi:hypothetical protein